jgi:hypothetical protein
VERTKEVSVGLRGERQSAICDSILVALIVVTQALAATAGTAALTFKIPPRNVPLNIGSQPITVIASGVISVGERGADEYVLSVRLNADLQDFQRHITGLMRAQLNKNEPCGDRIAIERAALIPADPSVRAVVQLHYEHYTCVKVFGKRRAEKLIAGDGIVQMKLTPNVINQNTLHVTPEVERIQANGSLGELLRAGPIGKAIREKITKALLSAMQKGTDRSLTLPPAVQGIASINQAQFEDEGAGRLGVTLAGQVAVSRQQIQLVKSQLSGRVLGR